MQKKIFFLAFDYMIAEAKVIITSLHFFQVKRLVFALWEQISMVIATFIRSKRAFSDI